MSRKKIDDEKLVEMLEEGKMQKEIAEYFGVSPVAVCKRIKKLFPSELPESLKKLTQKEQRFVVEIASGKTQTESAFNSFEVSSRESAKSIGSTLSKDPDIKTAIADLMNIHGAGKSARIKKLADHIHHRDANVSLKALDQSFKLDGSYTAEKHEYTYEYKDVSRELAEVNRQLAELDEKKAINAEFETIEVSEEEESMGSTD